MPPGGVHGEAYATVMTGTVAFLQEHKFGYLKVDSGGPCVIIFPIMLFVFFSSRVGGARPALAGTLQVDTRVV